MVVPVGPTVVPKGVVVPKGPVVVGAPEVVPKGPVVPGTRVVPKGVVVGVGPTVVTPLVVVVPGVLGTMVVVAKNSSIQGGTPSTVATAQVCSGPRSASLKPRAPLDREIFRPGGERRVRRQGRWFSGGSWGCCPCSSLAEDRACTLPIDRLVFYPSLGDTVKGLGLLTGGLLTRTAWCVP